MAKAFKKLLPWPPSMPKVVGKKYFEVFQQAQAKVLMSNGTGEIEGTPKRMEEWFQEISS
jgi:hypothetical protein